MVFPRQRALLVTNKAAQINFQLGEKSAAFPRKGTGVLSLSPSRVVSWVCVCSTWECVILVYCRGCALSSRHGDPYRFSFLLSSLSPFSFPLHKFCCRRNRSRLYPRQLAAKMCNALRRTKKHAPGLSPSRSLVCSFLRSSCLLLFLLLYGEMTTIFRSP